MSFKLKIFKKTLSLILAVCLFVNPLAVPIVFAEGEETPTPTSTEQPTPTPTEIVSPVADSEVTPTESPTPTVAPQSTITTGDAAASSQTDTTVNNNQDTVAGTLDTPPGNCTPPEGQTNCPDNIGIGNSNQAAVAETTDSLANTGENIESGSAGDASIETGNATASGQMVSDINSNTVTLETSITPTPIGSTAPEGISELEVNNENEGKVENNADISAKTGENVASENLGSVDLQTGDASAWLNLLNLLNTNIVGSNFEFLVLDVKDESNGEVNLNELWKQLQTQNSADSVFLVGDSSPNLRLIIRNDNHANLENNVNVCAATGDNQANQNNSAQLDTGNATALANVTNIVNTNILGSKFLFGIINITGQFKGNLILPRPERFVGTGETGVGGAPVIFANQNQAAVADTLSSTANTGNNQENNNGGSNTINTGSAQAVANDFSLINTNVWQNNWFYLLMNILGSWNGKTFNWSGLGSEEQTGETNQIYQTAEASPTPMVEFQNQNVATVINKISVNASTGGNQANGNQDGATINTGHAKASLNLINLINLNILASRWFMGLVNILGNWSGNAIFAYPDMTVSLSADSETISPGDSLAYALNFANQGYDEAEGVTIKMEFPRGVAYVGDSSGLSPNCDSQVCVWNIGHLARSQGGNFQVRVRVNPNILSPEKLSFWEKLIPKVYAAEDTPSFTVEASVITSDPESNSANNTASKTISINTRGIGGMSEPASEVDQRQPVLEVTSRNNVNEFVYAGDTVTFEVTIKNSGEVRSERTYLTHALFNGVPEDLGIADINVGTIEPGKTAKVSFGLVLKSAIGFHAGSYHTITKAYGYAPNNNKVFSNEARTDFKIRLKEIATFFEARAAEKREGEVLGAATENDCPVPPPPKDNILPYVLLFALSSLWIVDRSRRMS